MYMIYLYHLSISALSMHLYVYDILISSVHLYTLYASICIWYTYIICPSLHSTSSPVKQQLMCCSHLPAGPPEEGKKHTTAPGLDAVAARGVLVWRFVGLITMSALLILFLCVSTSLSPPDHGTLVVVCSTLSQKVLGLIASVRSLHLWAYLSSQCGTFGYSNTPNTLRFQIRPCTFSFLLGPHICARRLHFTCRQKKRIQKQDWCWATPETEADLDLPRQRTRLIRLMEVQVSTCWPTYYFICI